VDPDGLVSVWYDRDGHRGTPGISTLADQTVGAGLKWEREALPFRKVATGCLGAVQGERRHLARLKVR
jgi:hypothetical protein